MIRTTFSWVVTWSFRFGLLLAILVAVLWMFGSREDVVTQRIFDARSIGADVDAYLADREAAVYDIVPGAEKRVIWAGEAGARTDIALVYIHGFSATSEEIRPVPDRVAEALGANLFYTRLMGHGRGGAAMAEPKVAGWIYDLDEALAVAGRIGDRAVIIAASTGATIATLGLSDGREAAGVAMISPNFRLADPMAGTLTWPAARDWAPWIVGHVRSFEPINAQQARWWTTTYPTVALFPLGAMVKAAFNADVGQIDTPALFMFADTDTVVDHAATRDVAARWGGPTRIVTVGPGQRDDPAHHVIAGDIMSPGMTDSAVNVLVNWIKGL